MALSIDLRSKIVRQHALAWLAYDILLYLVNYISIPAAKFIDVLCLSIMYALVFYSNLYLLHRFMKKGTVILGILIILISFVLLSIIGYYYVTMLLPLMGIQIYPHQVDFISFTVSALVAYIRFLIYAVLYFQVQRVINKERQNARLEYSFLRSQVNPHFLHNTLNALFSQALNCSPPLADNIMKLSKLMRYSLESIEFDSGKVSIQKELEHLQALIDINNMRFSNTKSIEYSIDGEMRGQALPPLSIITVVENAFKYGDLKDPQNPLIIKVTLSTNHIYFYCKNKKRRNNIELSSHNIGLTNLRRRLDMAFKDKYSMKATNGLEFYVFELTINNN
ncbi:MAG: sensor histidine kinase [Chitinophagaceae bacterium]|nr:sensor histidine kinase [Chitinophagaceae bacterium]